MKNLFVRVWAKLSSNQKVRSATRDAAVVFLASAIAAVLKSDNGLTHLSLLDWQAAVDAGASSVLAFAALVLTPLTRRYGVGSGK